MKRNSKQDEMLVPAIEDRVDALLAKMTLLEKAGQLTQLSPSLVGGFDIEAFFENPDPDALANAKREFREDWIREGRIGSYLGVYGAEEINRLQRIAVEESRLGIPLIFGLDVIHGFRTIFPIPLAEACSWEPELAQRSAEIAAREAAAAGVQWTFAPMVDIARDPRWGRIAEGAGEDPFLGSAFAAARVAGFQGQDLADPDHVAACAKHYIAYGAAIGGRDYNTVDISLQTLHEIYLPPFRAAANAGAVTFMSAFNDLNGVPATANHYTLTSVLRGDLGFKGFVISDFNAIGELVPHGYAEDRQQAGKKALLAGVDMDMVTESFLQDLPALVEAGEIPEAVVDEAVRRVLRVKFLLGLFDRPYRTYGEKETKTLLREDHIAAAREVARRSIVLLKNANRILPLKKDLKKIAIVGPLADQAADMLGSWAFTGLPRDVVTPLEGIRAACGAGVQILHAPGCEVEGDRMDGFTAALEAAQGAEVVIAVVGEKASMSGEAASRLSLNLPGKQEDLLRALHQTGVPLVVVLINGRPLSIPWVEQHAAAILEAWQLGIQAGNAIADVLFGDYNPSGRLAVTFPYSVGQVPLYYNHPNTGRPTGTFKFTSKYIDGPAEPLYPFGYGLSYATFAYSDLVITPVEITSGRKITISARVANVGDVPGEEVAQLYVSDVTASRVRPVKELKGFQKFSLQPGECREIRFELDSSTLGFYNDALEYVVEPGVFKVWVGPNSREGLEGMFEI